MNSSQIKNSQLQDVKFKRPRIPILFFSLLILLLLLFLVKLGLGSVPIPFLDVFNAIFSADGVEPATLKIIYELRMPRAIASVFGGAGLGVAGLLLQTLFRNPLAGPWALGLTSGAQLGVAVVITTAVVVGSDFLENFQFISNLGIVAGAMLGCTLILILIVLIAQRVSTITLLIFGLMLGYLAKGLISVILHFTNQSQTKIFAGWNDGSFSGVYWEHFPVLIPMVILGLVGAWISAKPLNAFLFGENYARSMGVNIRRTRLITLACTVLLAAPITAYCGPILFLGLIIPHLARSIFNISDHKVLIPGVVLLGGLVAMTADLFVHLPWEKHFLHLNAVNALIGAPVVMWFILRNRRMQEFDI